jgi:hypothetical protein
VIAAVGDWWCYNIIDRGGIKPHKDETDDPVWDKAPENLDIGYNRANWSPLFRYGSPESAILETEVVTKTTQLLK